MREIKKVFRFFTIFEYEEEQAYLRHMHQSGWKFVKVSGFCCYYFEKCEPEDVIYQLDYNPDGIAHKAEYIQMFNDCGWEYMQDYLGYSYFRKPAAEAIEAEEIFCDETSRQEMLHRIFKNRLVPLFVLFSLVLIPEFVWCLYHGEYILGTFLGAMTGFYLFLLTHLVYKYNKLRQRNHC